MTDDPENAPVLSPHVIATVEAILFASNTPLTVGKIAQAAELPSARLVRQAVETLNARYEQVGSAFRIEHIAGGYQMLTQSRFGEVLARLSHQRSETRLTQAALETLAIVAYRQPILRADVEAIRGVACGEVLRGLMEKQLIRITGRAEVLGRPMLYGTTRRFLELFGLANLEDLPKVEELRSGAAGTRPAAGAQEPASPPPEPAPSSVESSPTDSPAPKQA
jgi:segregation and condensation protein B